MSHTARLRGALSVEELDTSGSWGPVVPEPRVCPTAHRAAHPDRALPWAHCTDHGLGRGLSRGDPVEARVQVATRLRVALAHTESFSPDSPLLTVVPTQVRGHRGHSLSPGRLSRDLSLQLASKARTLLARS